MFEMFILKLFPVYLVSVHLLGVEAVRAARNNKTKSVSRLSASLSDRGSSKQMRSSPLTRVKAPAQSAALF